MQLEELHTERLILRKLDPETLRYIYSHFSDEELMGFLGVNAEALAKEKDKYAHGLTTFNRSFLNFLLVDKENGNVIGACDFHTWYTDHSRAEIGYGMYGDDSKQQGLMSEALRPIIDYGFRVMGLHRIEAFVGPLNIPSLKLMDKFGFTREGLLREHYCKNGVMEDSVVFSLLKHELRSAE